MFDIGWTELLLIGVVALIVIGPKDLPDMFRQLGRFTAKLRAMAREFQRAMDEAAKESGAADIAKDMKTLTSPKSLGVDAVRSAADKFEKWDPLKNAAKPSAPQKSETIRPLTPPPMPPTPAPVAAPAPAPAPAPAEAGPSSVGPATQALYDKKAAKEAVLKEAAAKLKDIEAGAVAALPANPARKPRAKKAPAPGSGEPT